MAMVLNIVYQPITKQLENLYVLRKESIGSFT